MFKRLFWLSTGLGMGFGGSVWLQRRVRRTVERFAPERLTSDVRNGAKSVRTGVGAALDAGRTAMRDREAELRAEIVHRSQSR